MYLYLRKFNPKGIKMRILILIILIITIASCTFLNTPVVDAPKFPSSVDVLLIKTSVGTSITDNQSINKFLTALNSIKTDWSRTPFTYPSPGASINFIRNNDKQSICRVDFGPHWIGSNCGDKSSDWPPLTSTTTEQDQYFQNLIGKKW